MIVQLLKGRLPASALSKTAIHHVILQPVKGNALEILVCAQMEETHLAALVIKHCVKGSVRRTNVFAPKVVYHQHVKSAKRIVRKMRFVKLMD